MENIPRSEYPRPQFVRENWVNLNGPWEFAFDFGNSGEARGFYRADCVAFDRKIMVPFCPESKLSGIEYKDFMPSVWYRRTIEVTAEQLCGRVLLHFGAVDYRCTVYVNGEACGCHSGGYSSFQFDITKYLKAGENALTVHAEDDLRSGKQPYGKQSSDYYSAGCAYTRTTGIWQTVWMEYVPEQYLQSVQIGTDYRNGCVTFTASVEESEQPLSLKTAVSYQGRAVAESTIRLSQGNTTYSLQVEDVQLWDAGRPNLYDVTYELLCGGKMIDTVDSYFGFRTVELKDHAICLNGRPVYQRLVLDQGFYPEGVYTAPTDADLKKDIELSMALGFNGARLHQKVFEERFLYWADQLGYLVWGEQASWGLTISSYEGVWHFLPEWMEVVKRDFNHPAIVGWCPFNEVWDVGHRRADPRVLETIYRVTKAMDPTRPVIDTSGNFHAITDIYDVHDYEQDVAVFRERYGAVTRECVYETYPDRQKYEGQPYFVSEYGGTWWAPGQSGGWGYGDAPRSEEELAARYEGLTRALMENPAICALCYTQLYDVEQEQNGLYTYDRQPKFSPQIYDSIRKANSAPAANEKKEVL